MKNLPKIIVTSMMLILGFTGVLYLTGLQQVSAGVSTPVYMVGTTLLLLIVIGLVFKAVDAIYPPPASLSSVDAKAFFKSKVFWLAFLNLIFVILTGLTGVEVEDSVQVEILNLDWSNIGQALISILIIAIRKVDIFKYLTA